MNFRTLSLRFLSTACLSMLLITLATAQEKTKPVAPAPPESASPTPKDLRDGELAISGRYARFERMLSQMADVLGREDPERADLLRRAIGKGRDDQIKENMELAIKLLNDENLGAASEKQSEVVASLGTLLKLLQSEDRRSSVERERERLNMLLKDVRSVLAEQKSTRAATRSAEAPSSAAKGQQKALNEADRLLQSMKEHDDQGEDAEPGEDPESEAKNPAEVGEPKEGQPGNDDSKPGSPSKDPSQDSKDGNLPDLDENAKPLKDAPSNPEDGNKEAKGAEQGQKKSGQPDSQSGSESGSKSKSGGQGKGSKSKSEQKESPQTPGREELQNAREQMEQALEELKAQEREKALEKEDEAIEELHKAAAKLEEMLKQLREEEKEMLLASLEARFQRMLATQTQIHEATLTLAETPQSEWLDQYYARCRELAQQQSDLTTECSQTVNLLREDGTSVSILLAVEDIEADMRSVTGGLQEFKVGPLTQTLQTDIIESLKQLIETTQKEMQEMKNQDQQQNQNSTQQQQGLVDFMAEIRMLRNLQLQVNRRTKQVNALLQSSPSDEIAALNKQIHDLAVRQRRLIDSAKELAKQSR